MGRELQKRKRRSGAQPVRRPPRKDKKILSNPYIRENWNKNETLSQNYRRLGLVAKLNKRAGGVQKLGKDADKKTPKNPFAILPGTTHGAVSNNAVEEVKLVRDEETGELGVVGGNARDNPLDDPLNDLEDDEDDGVQASGSWITTLGHVGSEKDGVARTAVTDALEEMARDGRKKPPRHQSTREEEWIEKLVEKHGDDYESMFRDRKLNIMQQSVGDIKKRVKMWAAKRKAIAE